MGFLVMASGNESEPKTSTDDLELFEELAIASKLSQPLSSWARDSSSDSSYVDASRRLSSEVSHKPITIV